MISAEQAFKNTIERYKTTKIFHEIDAKINSEMETALYNCQFWIRIHWEIFWKNPTYFEYLKQYGYSYKHEEHTVIISWPEPGKNNIELMDKNLEINKQSVENL